MGTPLWIAFMMIWLVLLEVLLDEGIKTESIT